MLVNARSVEVMRRKPHLMLVEGRWTAVYQPRRSVYHGVASSRFGAWAAVMRSYSRTQTAPRHLYG